MFPVLPVLLSETQEARRVMRQQEFCQLSSVLQAPSCAVINKETPETVNNLTAGHQAPPFSLRSK